MLVGLGSFAMAQQVESSKKIDHTKVEQNRGAKFDELKKELNLTDTQVAQIKALKEEQNKDRARAFEESKEMRAKKLAEMKEKKEKHNAEMKKILTPEQFAKWEAKRAQKIKKQGDIKKTRSDKAKVMLKKQSDVEMK